MYTIWLTNEFHKVSPRIVILEPWYVYEWNDTIMNEYRIMWFILWEQTHIARMVK